MSYRDDLEAGRRREEALEEKIAEQQRELAELRRKQKGGASEATTSPTEPVGEPPPESSSSTSVWGRMIAVVLSVALPALGIVGPCVCEVGRRMDQAEREAAAAKDEALFTHRAKITWSAAVERTEGIYFPPSTPCRISLDARSDGKRLRGELELQCGATAVYKQGVDQVSCQLEEANGGGGHRYRVRCLPPETNEDGARLMDLDTKLRRAEVRDAEKKGFVLLHVAEWSDERDGSALFET